MRCQHAPDKGVYSQRLEVIAGDDLPGTRSAIPLPESVIGGFPALANPSRLPKKRSVALSLKTISRAARLCAIHISKPPSDRRASLAAQEHSMRAPLQQSRKSTRLES